MANTCYSVLKMPVFPKWKDEAISFLLLLFWATGCFSFLFMFGLLSAGIINDLTL